MTQVRLSTELGVAQETVSAYENGKHDPSLRSLLQMAALFDASSDYILGRSDIRRPTKDTALGKEEGLLLSLYGRLTPVQKAKALAYVEGLADQEGT